MRVVVLFVVLLMASQVSAQKAYTGICIVDALINVLDYVFNKATCFLNPTTTTTTSTTTTTTSTSTTSTTETTVTSTTVPSTTVSTTTTTLFEGECMTEADCPETKVVYSCNMDGNIVKTTTNYLCFNPGPDSECKGRVASRIHKFCKGLEKCVKGVNYCV